jgi:putative heme-binding domain-containing protein
MKQAIMKRAMLKRTMLSAVVAASIVGAQPSSAQQANPFEADEVAIRAGAAWYGTRCADCHGADAKGARGPDLTLLWAGGTDDGRVFESIRAGRQGSIMPPSTAPDDEIWAVVAYLRSISTVPPFASGKGNPARGRERFATHCAQCHRVGQDGGALGPDLSRIGAVRSREALSSAIMEPSASVAPGYRTVVLTTRSGETIRGVAKSEDAFSIQIVDTHERLQGYRKSDLAALTHESQSLMPELWPDELNDRRLDDVIAYLGTLRGSEDSDE